MSIDWKRGSKDSRRSSTTRRRAILLLALFATLPYANALCTGFALDDEFQIRTNPAVTGGIDFIQILSSPLYPGDLFRPFTVLTFAINEWLTPGSPAPLHAMNVMLHAAVAVLVYLLARRLLNSGRAAFVSAALFAVHPIHTEAVTGLVGRAEILAALFGLGALLSAARAAAAATRPSRTALQMLSLALFCLALLSKESAATILPLIILFRIVMRGDTFAVGLWRELHSLDWVPYMLCTLVFVVWRLGVTAPFDRPLLDNVLVFVPWAVRIHSALGVLWDYFGLLNVPLVLATDYSYNQVPVITSWWTPRLWAGCGLVTLATACCMRRRWTGVVFAVAFPFVTLSLTANVLFPIGTIKAERLLYLPSVGWALLAGWGFDCLLRRPRYRTIALTLLCTLMVAFTARTWIRNWDWQDNMVLYQSMVRSAPESAKARYNFGVVLQRRGDNEAASAQFHRALEIYPWEEDAALGIGIGFEREGRTEAALQWYRKVLEIAPSFDQGHLRLCRVLVNAHRFVEAATACRAGLRYRPADPELLKGVGASLMETGAVEAGINVLHRALALNPKDEELRSFLMHFSRPEIAQSFAVVTRE
jgi:hypothetical protein